jgi:hypothetical protein
MIAIRLLVLASVLATPPGQSVRVTPAIVRVNGAAWVTCHVPSFVNNRTVEIGIGEYASSTRPMDGDQAPITYQLLFEHLPCESVDAFCLVTRILGRPTMTRTPLTMAFCGGPDQ